MDTKSLRQKILDLAIRGKLVPQDPNDEPASVLLERIRAEKERLIAEGKIKRPKNSKASSAESHYGNFVPPFEIPDSWQWVRLGDLSEIKGGTTIPKELELDKGILPYIKVSDFNTPENAVEITTSNRYVDEWKCNQVIKADSILFPKRGGAIFTDKKRITRIDILADLNIMSVHPFFCFEFVFLWFNSFSLSEIQSGSNIPQINNQDLEPLMIPLPPIEEQIRICNKANSLLSIVNNLYDNKHDLKNIISIAKSKILELAMQGKLVPQDSADEPAAEMLRRVNPKARIICDTPHYPQLPENWAITHLADVATLLSGRDLESSGCNSVNEGIPYLIGASNICNGCMNINRWTKHPQVVSSKNDILFSCKGTIGELLINDYGNIHIARQFMAIRCMDCIRPDYLRFAILNKLASIKKNANGIIPGISRQVLLGLTIFLPPMKEQDRILLKLKEIESYYTSIQQSLN